MQIRPETKDDHLSLTHCMAVFMVTVLTACGARGLEAAGNLSKEPREPAKATADLIKIVLPEPNFEGSLSLEEVLLERRSVRDFKAEALTDAQIGQRSLLTNLKPFEVGHKRYQIDQTRLQETDKISRSVEILLTHT